MTTIHDVRRENLEALLTEYRDSTDALLKECAAWLGMQPAQLAQYRHGHREIGGVKAREIEEKAGKPHGWLDMRHTGLSAAAARVAERWEALDDAGRAHLLTTLDVLEHQRDRPPPSTAVSLKK